MPRSLSLVMLALASLGMADDGPQSAPVPADRAAANLTLPEGFSSTLFAGEPDVVQPIAFTIDPRGRLWVVECYSYPEWSEDGTGRDRVLIFEDVDGDGRFDSRKVFYDRGVNLSGIELGFGGVYLCSTPNFLFIPDRDGDDVPDGAPEVLLNGWSLDAQHNVFNGLTWGPDGWLYGGNGILATSLVGKPGTPEDKRTAINCGVWRYHPVTREFEVVASGTTNPWGLDFDADGELFITNCVIPHLYHVVPGAHYERMYGQDLNAHVYELLKTCADHVHWDTREVWSDIRKLGVTPTTDRAGGGHAHVGAMVYLGDNWPVEYRGDVFMCNVHGHRVNRDTLRPSGSTVVASHRPDFLLANDDWFRGLELQYGPDGAVYITDWSDTGECHEADADGAHRENGRILKVAFGTPKPVRVDLASMSELELVKLLSHENEWYPRIARRLLQERAATGRDMAEANVALRALSRSDAGRVVRLRALWTLNAIGRADGDFLRAQLDDANPQVRAWAVRLLADRRPADAATLGRFAGLARSDESPRVRLALASALQRLGEEARRPIATALASRAEDAGDAMLPLMVWYGVEPVVASDLRWSADLVAAAELPAVRRFAARRLVEADPAAGLAALLPRLADVDDSARRSDALDGILDALRGRRSIDAPDSWPDDRVRLLADAEPTVRDRALQLGLKFGDEGALGTLRNALSNDRLPLERRRMALESLVSARVPDLAPDLRKLVEAGDPVMLGPAIRALAALDDPATPGLLIDRYASLPNAVKADAVATLAARPATAPALLDAIEAGTIPRRDLPIAVARQILAMGDEALTNRLESAWGSIRPTSSQKAELVDKYRRLLAPETLASAEPSRGRAVFRRSCASCHKLFDEGADIGPELTGSDRANLDYVLENVLDPSATVGRDYKLVVVATADGRVLSGMIREQDDRAIVLQTPNERVILPRDEVDELRPSDQSMMPEGLFEELTPEQVRDLVSYLASKAQVPAATAGSLKSAPADGR